MQTLRMPFGSTVERSSSPIRCRTCVAATVCALGAMLLFSPSALSEVLLCSGEGWGYVKGTTLDPYKFTDTVVDVDTKQKRIFIGHANAGKTEYRQLTEVNDLWVRFQVKIGTPTGDKVASGLLNRYSGELSMSIDDSSQFILIGKCRRAEKIF